MAEPLGSSPSGVKMVGAVWFDGHRPVFILDLFPQGIGIDGWNIAHISVPLNFAAQSYTF